MRASAWWAVLPLLVLSPALTAPARGQDTPPPPGQKKPGQQPGQQQPGQQPPGQQPPGQQQPGQQPGQQQPGQPGQQPGTPPPGGQQPPPTTPGIPPPVEPQRLEPQTIEPQTIEPDLVEPQPLPLPGPTDPDATGEPDLDGAEPGPGGTGPAAAGAIDPNSGGGWSVETRGQSAAATSAEDEATVIDPLAPSDLTVDPNAAALDPRRQAEAAEAARELTAREERGEALREARPVPAGRTELGGIDGGAISAFGLADRRDVEERGLRLNKWLVLAPVLRFEAAYDDNVFRARSNSTDPEEDDIELIGSMGLTLVARPVRELYLSLSYALLYRTFASESGVNSLDHFVRLNGSWTTRRFGVGTSLTVAKLNRPDDPRFGGAQVERLAVEGQFTGQVQITRRVGLRAEETVQVFDYDNVDALDQLALGVNLLVTVQAARPLTLLAGAGVRELRYTSSDAVNPDLRLFSPLVGAELRLSQRLTFTLRLGYEIGQITDDRGQTGLDAPSGPVITAAAAWEPNLRWRFSAELTRQITTAVVGSSQTSTRFGVEARRRFGPRISVYARGGVELQEPQNSNDDLTAFNGEVGADWRLKDWLTLGTYVSYLSSDSDARGDFEVMRAGVSLTFTP